MLRQNYGQVVVNFGEPIPLDDMLALHAPEWNGEAIGEEDKPAWLSRHVDALADRIQIHINRAADVNPINLLALALLSTPKHAMGEADLLAQIELCKTLLSEMPYSDRVTITPHTPERIIAHGLHINVLQRIKHPLGDVLDVVSEDTAVLMSYYRNNVLHLFTAAAWIACCFQTNRRMVRSRVMKLGRSLYPFLQAELFLPWTEDEFAERIDHTIDVFVREGLLEQVNEDDGGILQRNAGQTDEVFRLRAIGHSLQQAFERYYIAISVLVKNGPGTLGTAELESLCQLAAQRLTPAVRACRAGVLRQDAVPRLHPETARTETGLARRQQQAGVRRTPGRLGQGRQSHPGPRTTPHHRARQPGSGQAGSGTRRAGLTAATLATDRVWPDQQAQITSGLSGNVRISQPRAALPATGWRTNDASGEAHSSSNTASSTTRAMRNRASPEGRITGGRYS